MSISSIEINDSQHYLTYMKIWEWPMATDQLTVSYQTYQCLFMGNKAYIQMLQCFQRIILAKCVTIAQAKGQAELIPKSFYFWWMPCSHLQSKKSNCPLSFPFHTHKSSMIPANAEIYGTNLWLDFLAGVLLSHYLKTAFKVLPVLLCCSQWCCIRSLSSLDWNILSSMHISGCMNPLYEVIPKFNHSH